MSQENKKKRSSRRRLKKGWKIFFVAFFLILIAIMAAVIFLRYFTTDVGFVLQNAGISSATASIPSQISVVDSESSEPIDSQSPMSSQPSQQESAPVEQTTGESEQTTGETSVPEKVPGTANYFDQVTPGVTIGDFSKALFIGDSRTQGFMLYSGLTEARYYTGVGLNVDTAFKKAVVTGENGGEITIPQALEAEAGRYNKVYLGFGVNELGWIYSDVFIQKYQELIQLIRTYQPDAKIYLQSIMPVTAERSASDVVFNNPHIAEYNVLLQDLATQANVTYVDLFPAVADAAGCLPADAASDGIHLNKSYVLKWLEYLRANT